MKYPYFGQFDTGSGYVMLFLLLSSSKTYRVDSDYFKETISTNLDTKVEILHPIIAMDLIRPNLKIKHKIISTILGNQNE
jgi:hypothetical protein